MFDKVCSTYWCDTCGREMLIDYSRSTEYGIVLKCIGNDGWRCFASIDNNSYEEVTKDDGDAEELVVDPDPISRANADSGDHKLDPRLSVGTSQVQAQGRGPRTPA